MIVGNTTSSHRDVLFTYSPSFSKPDGTEGSYYYQALSINISVGGYYRFVSNSAIDTYVYLYHHSFSPSNPSTNLIISDNDSADNMQLSITIYLQGSNSYVLVVTTYESDVSGSFIVIATGPSSIQFTPYSSSARTLSYQWSLSNYDNNHTEFISKTTNSVLKKNSLSNDRNYCLMLWIFFDLVTSMIGILIGLEMMTTFVTG